MRTALLHCGLHTTGAAALQNALRTHPAALEQMGFYYPRAGRVGALGGGHHNLAWQLAGDPRFEPRAGDIAALGLELELTPGRPHPVLSSEDFEPLLADPSSLGPLLDVLRRHSDRVLLLLYLRDQVSALEAGYALLLAQCVALDYADFVELALRQGAVRLPEMSLLLDYNSLLDGVASAAIGRLAVRNVHALPNGSPLADFCRLTRLDPAQFSLPEAASPTLTGQLRLFHRNHARCPPDAFEEQAIAILAAGIGTRRIATSRTARLRIAERFRSGNVAVCTQYGLPSTGLGLREGVLEPDLSLESLFSAATRELIAAMAGALRAGRTEAAAALPASLFGGYSLAGFRLAPAPPAASPPPPAAAPAAS